MYAAQDTPHRLVGMYMVCGMQPCSAGRHLAAGSPAGEAVQVQGLRCARQRRSRQAAESVAAVRLVARLPADAALVCLSKIL